MKTATAPSYAPYVPAYSTKRTNPIYSAQAYAKELERS